MVERVERRQVRRIAVAPPEIHHRPDLVERGHAVPPQARHVERVARPKLGGFRGLQRLAETRVPLEVRIFQVDQAGRLPREREVQRTDVEVLELIGREERELASPGDDTGEVLRQVPVRRRPRAIAEPQRDQHRALRDRAEASGSPAAGRADASGSGSRPHTSRKAHHGRVGGAKGRAADRPSPAAARD